MSGNVSFWWVLKPAMIEALPFHALYEPLQVGEPIAASRSPPEKQQILHILSWLK
jgi:hypothetical protein